jgi:hypothetical protein
VPLSGVTSIESDYREHDDMTELTPILNFVHKYNDSLQRRRMLFSVVTSIDSYCREQGDMTEMTPILNRVAHVRRQLALSERATQDGHQHRK